MEQFLTLLQGPAAATVLMGAILYTAYKFVLTYAIPRFDQTLKESNERFNAVVAEHKADRDAFVHTIERITARIDKMNEVTDEMARSVEGLHKSVSEIHQKLQDERLSRN